MTPPSTLVTDGHISLGFPYLANGELHARVIIDPISSKPLVLPIGRHHTTVAVEVLGNAAAGDQL